MSVKPIKASECKKGIPDEILIVFNELIQSNFDGRKSVVYQKDILSILKNRYDFDENIVYENNWLDIEELYRDAGWTVIYYQPGCYDAYFRFESK